MSRRGNCLDNASMERFFTFLKTEGHYPYDIPTLDEAQKENYSIFSFLQRKRPPRK
ncbi:hypothetical protein FE782_12355 [Paenibacillus antri]|uniref:Integrase catalytic domain-containing protein n=1 Tax=Paenibacillus antri TaxID=2582848 RepID=A0A5R9GFU6_9BACL|nr:hypothetical protein FE782_12355 [Paenibacillus antri]